MDVEMQEDRDFLAQHAPFDALPAGALDSVPRRCTLRYARRGTVVLDVGEVGVGLYVVRSGSVDVVDETGALVERVGPGGAFGMSSLLERRPTRYRCAATEDTLLIVLARDAFDDLAPRHTGAANAVAALEAGVTTLDASIGRAGGCPVNPERHRERRDRGPGLPLRPDGGGHRVGPGVGHRERPVARGAAREGAPRRPVAGRRVPGRLT
jgi:hypothetical protein